MRTLSNQTLPDKSSKPGSYPIIDVKNTITCSNEYNNVTFLNQDNIAIASENITFKIPPDEIPTPRGPCDEPLGGWFETTGERPVLWRSLIEAFYGPGYERKYLGVPVYQWFYVRVPYNWDYVSDFGNVFGSYTWDWQFQVNFSMSALLYGSSGIGLYQWRYDSTNGLHLREYNGSSWQIVYTIGKLSDWQCTGQSNPYQDNAFSVPSGFIITPNDLVGSGYALTPTSFLGGLAGKEITYNFNMSRNIQWNDPDTNGYWRYNSGSLNADRFIIYIECSGSGGQMLNTFIAQRYYTPYDWLFGIGRWETPLGVCQITGGFLSWGGYNLNDKSHFVLYLN